MHWIECQVSGKINDGFGILAAIQRTSVFCNLFMRYSHLFEPFHKQFVRKVQLMHASRVLVRVWLTRFLGPL